MAITPKLSLPVKCWSSRMLLLVQALGGALGYTHTVDSSGDRDGFEPGLSHVTTEELERIGARTPTPRRFG
jgi:hypothetical protein